MTHTETLRALRDETVPDHNQIAAGYVSDEFPSRIPEQIAALDHVIKREEALANAEGHAALLNDASLYQCLYPAKRKQFEVALKAGALALTERAALIAEVERLQSSTQRCLAVMKDMQQCPPPEHSQHAPWLKLWFSRINETINSVEACAALKESHNG